MKISASLAGLMLALSIAACDNTPVQKYVHGLVLFDATGCAFNAEAFGGYSVRLNFNRQASGPKCDFKNL